MFGKVDAPLPPSAPPIRCVCTDSRDIKPDSVFFAIPGDNFDGHDYVNDAFEKGAVVAVVDREMTPPAGKFVIEVPDVRKALGRLASHVREGMRHTKIIAVAGSVGKTGTKHLVHAALGARLPGGMSPKSFNNDIGVPLTIFAAEPHWQYLVLELGTNHPGEIEHLSRTAKPDLAIITNAGEEHLEHLGSLDGVRHENAQVVVGMDAARGLLVVNGDDPDLRRAVDGWWKGRSLTFGSHRPDDENGNPAEQADLFATDVAIGWDGTRFNLNGSRTQLHIPQLGAHVATNALAAVAVARRLGLGDQEIAKGLANATGPEMRLEPTHLKLDAGDVRVLNDAYNANPPSVRAALATLTALPATGRRVVALGDMFELGTSGPGHHYAVGRLAAKSADVLILVGELMTTHAAEAARTVDDCQVHTFPDVDATKAELPTLLEPGDTLLVKGSRGMGMEQMLNAE
ncbi:MAG: UDP-N-acetylmuramoyl-tripeptide--D-alanyl-D-alanine ligase [Planctomycetota bacterium]